MSLAIPEATYFRICAAAQWLEPQARAPFYQAVGAELRHGDIGDGSVNRAIYKEFRAHYRAPLEADERRVSKPLRKLSMHREEAT